MFPQLIQANGRGTGLFRGKAGRQILPLFQGAVGDGDLLGILGSEVGGAQLDHFPGADEEDFLLIQGIENALGQMDPGGGHGDDIGANGGGGAHFLGHGEGPLEQLVQ